jgi:NitT/TauT family transport system substrate-binding protein
MQHVDAERASHLSGYTPATLILAPMAMALREQGVPIKIVYQLL